MSVKSAKTPNRASSKRERAENALLTFLRVVRYMRLYPVQVPVIFISICISAAAGIAGMYFIKPVINDCLVPLITNGRPDFTVFYAKLAQMAGLFATSILFCTLYNRLIVNVSTAILCRLREEMFAHMMKMPVRYFDENAVGKSMSLYTNDTDALREAVSMGLPHIIFSAVTIAGIFTAMLILSPLLTLILCVLMSLTLWAVCKIGRKSAVYFVRQQEALGDFDAFIEEHISGSRVVKVFCREEKTAQEFELRNEALFDAAKNANPCANILMPIVGNLSYMQYAVIAVSGALLAIAGVLDIGTIAAFLQYTRMSSQPVSQMSQQTNAVLTALAGAERIFKLLDTPQETDDGYVGLVPVTQDADACRPRLDGDGGVVGQAGGKTGGIREDIVKLTQLFAQGAVDRLDLTVRHAVTVNERIDVEAVTKLGGNATCRGVRLLEIAHRFQLSHFVADGSRRTGQLLIPREVFRADGATVCNMRFDNRLQDFSFSVA